MTLLGLTYWDVLRPNVRGQLVSKTERHAILRCGGKRCRVPWSRIRKPPYPPNDTLKDREIRSRHENEIAFRRYGHEQNVARQNAGKASA